VRATPDLEEHEEDEVPVGRAKSLWVSFGYAWQGLRHSFLTQRNFRIHVAAAIVALIVGLVLRFSPAEWAMVALVVVVVLAAEMVNTMVEALVDLVSPRYHPLAKVAKDVAAGVVLLTAIGAVVVGLLLFGPRFLAMFRIW
jgi:diacylglycerol kinase (ATP)